MSARYYDLNETSSMWVEHRSDECPYCGADGGWYFDGAGCIRPVRTIPGPDTLPAEGIAWQERSRTSREHYARALMI